jgi:hypothetical protein
VHANSLISLLRQNAIFFYLKPEFIFQSGHVVVVGCKDVVLVLVPFVRVPLLFHDGSVHALDGLCVAVRHYPCTPTGKKRIEETEVAFFCIFF